MPWLRNASEESLNNRGGESIYRKINIMMKKLISEAQLRTIVKECVKKVLKEYKTNSTFKSKEDATYWRDLYQPDDPYGEDGPYLSHSRTVFDDGDYDYCGDDMHNEYVDDYNRRLKKQLATKGGQMSYDYAGRSREAATKRDIDRQHAALDRWFDQRKKNNDWVDRQGKNLMRGWVNGKLKDADDMEILNDPYI